MRQDKEYTVTDKNGRFGASYAIIKVKTYVIKDKKRPVKRLG